MIPRNVGILHYYTVSQPRRPRLHFHIGIFWRHSDPAKPMYFLILSFNENSAHRCSSALV